MSVTEVTTRIQQLNAQFALLTPQRPGATVVGAKQAGPPVAADFAQALAGRTTPAATAGAAGTAGATATTGVERTTGAETGGRSGGVSGADVVAEARKYLGVPYVWGGTDPKRGLDCSGLVQLVYRNLGVELPRVSYQQATAGKAVSDLAHARPGDILAFGQPVRHVGIYIGDNKMIEAPRPGKDVRVTELYETPTAIRRVLPDAPPAATTQAALSSVPYADLFTRAGQRHGVDATLLAAVAKQESAYNPRAVSPAGAQGLMQLMPGTAEGLGVRNSFDPAQAVDGAARLLRDLLREFGQLDLALAAYNAGPGAVHRYDGIPPYPETQNYVKKVLAHRSELAA